MDAVIDGDADAEHQGLSLSAARTAVPPVPEA